MQANDGNFYGAAPYGGNDNGACSSGCGTIFKLSPTGVLSTLYVFCSQPNCTDGATPHTVLVQAGDGDLYGTTYYGGAYNYGIGFQDEYARYHDNPT